MKLRLVPIVAALGAAVLALTIVTAGQAGPTGKGDVYGTDHDVGSDGNPTCAQCHTPHLAEGAYLWSQVPNSVTLGESVLIGLCWSCHDGTVATSGAYLPTTGHTHNQGTVIYSGPDHIPGTADDYPITEHAMYETSCKKCMEPDCGKCHDPHDDAWVFIDSAKFPNTTVDPDATPASGDEVTTEWQNASICANCHEGQRHGVETYEQVDTNGDTVPDTYVAVEHSTHPEMITDPDGAADTTLPADRGWNGNIADFSGTRLWSDATTYTSRIGKDTSQYVVPAPGAGDVRCMTCHTPHGGDNDTINSMADADPASSHSPICDNCHQ